MGAFNIDLLQFNKHIPTDDFINNTFSRSLVPDITHTSTTFISVTLIDHIYMNNVTNPSMHKQVSGTN